MSFALSATIGGLISISGIIMGNAAIWKMMDAYQSNQSDRSDMGEMFMTGEVANPGNLRAEAGSWYRKTNSGGPLLKMLRYGQLLSVAGPLVTFALLVI